MKKKILSLVFLLSLFLGINQVLAATTNSGDYGLTDTMKEGNLSSAFNKTEVDKRTAGGFLSYKSGQLVGALLSFIGVVFMVLIIAAGLMWMTSGGNQSKVDKAKDLMIAAIIGLVIVLSAYAITAFIGREITNTAPLGA